MKALKCEMCGSNDVVKQDGLYVCQNCGTKYTVEEARKMMIEGMVEVQGTVKIDKSNEIDNLLKLAQEAISSINGEEAYAYAKRVLEIEPNNAQAWFLRMKGVDLTAILEDLKVLEVINAGNNAIKYSNNELSKDVYVYFLTKCLNDLKFCMDQFTDEKISNPSSGPCYVATAVYGSYNCPEVWTLRRFRDNTLDTTWYGRVFIKTYYAISPTLVKWFGETSWFKRLWRKPLDKLVASLRNKGVEDTPYIDKY